MNRQQHLKLLLFLLVLPALACGLGDGDTGPPADAELVEVVANTSLTPWLEEAIASFNEMEVESANGRPVYVILTATDAGQAVANMADGPLPDLWIPDSSVWVDVLQERGVESFDSCVSVAESPLVIAMWRPLAESLGWPGRDLGWLDIGSLAADPGAWAYYSGGQFGETLRLGHTHPGLSATGASTLLAVVQAAEPAATAGEVPVDAEDVSQPIVQASVGAFESAVSWFSSNTANLAQTMSERGIDFLGAAVVYESDVIHYGDGEPEIIPVYPFEGTYVAEHVACLNEASADAEAALLFRNYLHDGAAQEMAAAVGLRPVDDGVALGAPFDEARGIDLSQPETVFATPDADALFAAQELWQSARKDVNLVMLLDVSGSMYGEKIDSMRRAAVQFVEQMGEDDVLTLIVFSSEPQVLIRNQRVGDNRAAIVEAIQNLISQGDTTLYDAIGQGATIIADNTRTETTDAMIVLTDGNDTASYLYSAEEAAAAASVSGATVFTIAYGGDADEELLQQLALSANGNYFQGDEASITAIYQEMSAAFGGAVGVGR